ncbi:MAG: hypothetical protein ABIR68_03035 [Ilumatobacteraceae bacterium]
MTTATSASESGQSQLAVEFCGDQRVLTQGDELTFGRTADLVIDENRYLHRVVGRFAAANGLWWLTNVGSSIALTVSDAGGPSFAKLAPGRSMVLSFDSCTVGFEAGGANYELLVDVLGTPDDADDEHDDDTDDDTDNDDELVGTAWSGEVTTTASSLPMSAEQRLLLVALAEAQLRDPAAALDLPTNRQLASSLGWTITKYNRKLDGLCVKFATHGVSGLRGSSDALARDRRLRLVDHSVHAGVVTADDLGLLDAARERLRND